MNVPKTPRSLRSSASRPTSFTGDWDPEHPIDANDHRLWERLAAESDRAMRFAMVLRFGRGRAADIGVDVTNN
jgi:hypothetical protein